MAETRKEIEEALRGSFLFPLLGPSERDRFIAAAHARCWRAGASIFVQDDPGTSMMLVRTGTVRIGYPTPEGRTFLLAELGPGSVFGEIALLDGGPRSADATAATDCTPLGLRAARLPAAARAQLEARRGGAARHLRPAAQCGRPHRRPRLLRPARTSRQDADRPRPARPGRPVPGQRHPGRARRHGRRQPRGGEPLPQEVAEGRSRRPWPTAASSSRPRGPGRGRRALKPCRHCSQMQSSLREPALASGCGRLSDGSGEAVAPLRSSSHDARALTASTCRRRSVV